MRRHRPTSPRSTLADDAEPAANVIERLVERSLSKGAGRSRAQAEGIIRSHPDASPADVIALLETRYRRSLSVFSGGVGLAAAVPGIGTAVAAVLTAATLGRFLRVSATFVGAVAHVHGIAPDDVARRRALLLASLLGEDGSRALHDKLGVRTLYSGRGLVTRLPVGTVSAVNRGLSRRLVRALTAKGSVVLVGRLAPFGLGAVIGWFAGRRLANQVLTGVREVFGPAPTDHTHA